MFHPVFNTYHLFSVAMALEYEFQLMCHLFHPAGSGFHGRLFGAIQELNDSEDCGYSTTKHCD